MSVPQWVKGTLSFNLQEGKSAIFCSPNLPLYLWHTTQLYSMFFTAEFASTIQYPELWILFSVIPRPLWPVSLWWCFVSKSVIFPTFGNNIGCLHSLFKKDFSNLPPTWITSSPSRNRSKQEIMLLLSNDLFKSLEFSTDFNNQSSSSKLRCCTIFINLVFASSSKLVLSRVAQFTFLMMLCWLILDNRISLNLITSATTLTILDQSDIRFSRAVKTSADCGDTHSKFFLQFRILFVDWRYYFAFIPSCLSFPKKLWYHPRYHLFTLSLVQTSIPLDA